MAKKKEKRVHKVPIPKRMGRLRRCRMKSKNGPEGRGKGAI